MHSLPLYLASTWKTVVGLTSILHNANESKITNYNYNTKLKNPCDYEMKFQYPAKLNKVVLTFHCSNSEIETLEKARIYFQS